MELMRCFESGCEFEVEYTCPCTSPGTLSCELHLGKHIKVPNKSHEIQRIFVEPCKGTKEAILQFLTRQESKNSKMKEKILASFSQRLRESEKDIDELLKNIESGSAEIRNYFTKIYQTQKLSKSEQDPILGLLSLQPDEAIEKLKKIISVNQEWHNSAKLFCGLNEKIEKIIECFIEGKFKAYLNKRLSSIENSLEEHNKVINSSNRKYETYLGKRLSDIENSEESNKAINLSDEEHKKIAGSTSNELTHIKDSLSKLLNKNKKYERNLEDLKNEINLKIDLLNTQNLLNNETLKPQKELQTFRDKRSEILNRPIDPKIEKDFRITCSNYESNAYIYDPLLQQDYQDYISAYCKKTSLYTIIYDNIITNLIVYNTENNSSEARMLETPEILDCGTCIAQLPNGSLFCFGRRCDPSSGISLIIGENYKVQKLPSGISCSDSSAVYFNNSVYCFGGKANNSKPLALSERFDMNESRWYNLCPLPQSDCNCNSVIFNENILISGFKNKNIIRYSINGNAFTTIPYDFKINNCKVLINTERLYLIEVGGSIHESEVSNDSVWRRIANSSLKRHFYQVYSSYNKGAINILFNIDKFYYLKFDLKEKKLIDCNKH